MLAILIEFKSFLNVIGLRNSFAICHVGFANPFKMQIIYKTFSTKGCGMTKFLISIISGLVSLIKQSFAPSTELYSSSSNNNND